MGSCMAQLNFLPPRAAGVNYWFFLLSRLVAGVGKKQNAKCEMLLCKIDSEINVQTVDFLRNCEMETVATCSTTDGYAFTSVYVYTIATVVLQLTGTTVATHPRRRISKRWHVANIKNFNGDNQATLMVDRKNLQFNLFTFMRSQLMLQRRLRGWWRLPEIAQTARSRRQKHPGSIEIPQVRKFMPTKSSKMSRKTFFCCYVWRRYWRQCALFFFPTITCNCFCSHLRKIISERPLTPSKNRDTHIVSFFVDSIYNKTIDIIR